MGWWYGTGSVCGWSFQGQGSAFTPWLTVMKSQVMAAGHGEGHQPNGTARAPPCSQAAGFCLTRDALGPMHLHLIFSF